MKLRMGWRTSLAAATAVGVAAGVGIPLAITGGSHGGAVAGPAPSASPPHVPVTLQLIGTRHGTQPAAHPVRLRVAHGTLLGVSGRGRDGERLAGAVGGGGARWVSTTPLVPVERYVLTVRLRDDTGATQTRDVTVVTAPATRVATTAIAPLAGRTVGVGQPVVVRFSRPVTARAAAERGLRVHSSRHVVGAWHWLSSTEVHFRPRTYWPAHQDVTLRVGLRHVQLAPGVWGEDRTVAFHIGAAHVSVVDVAGHTMSVRSDGTLLRVVKVSTGRDRYPTLGGAHIVIEKQPVRVMDSSTVGIPKGDPDYYRETVRWDVRISYGGAFVHSAPWSVDDQGVRNVSHGCVNLSPADARWFYGLARPGDVVDVVRAARPPNLADPGMADWNVSWRAWLDGSVTGPVTT